MKITRISNEHLVNRIRFFERMLSERPNPSYYVGDSEFAEEAVEQENRQNDKLAERIMSHIKYMKSQAVKRGLKLK